MTIDEAIKRYVDNADYERAHGNLQGCLEFKQLANWLKELKQLKEQEPCEDAVSREAVLEQAYAYGNGLEPDGYCVNVEDIQALPPVTPTHIETVTEFTDRCRECGKTAITRAENDEILNEAWRLLMNVTEGDGVSTEQANGMLKLMAFFFYKYHGLKKKSEWAENVEARLANPTPEEYKMHPIKDGFPKTNSVRYLVQDVDGRFWDAEYDECQDNPAERFGEWVPTFKGGGLYQTEWSAYPEIVAWAELPELYEE